MNADLASFLRQTASLTVETSPSLTMSAVSSTFRAHFSEHSEKSAISLSLMVLPFPTQARSQSLRSGTQSDPTISSITTAIGVQSIQQLQKIASSPAGPRSQPE